MQPIQCITNLEKHISDIVLFSGRYLFRLGKYHECLETPSMDYFFIQLGTKGTDDQSLFYGTCLPKACSNNTIHLLLNAALDSVKIPLQAKSVLAGIGSYQYNYTWPFFLTFFIFAFLISVVFISTFSRNSSKLIGSFSISETTKIFNYHSGSKLNVFNGIRSLAMFWVIYGHAMSMSVGYSENILTIQKHVLDNWKFLTVSGGLYSVDTFFFVGGFLVAYAFLKQKHFTAGKYFLAILNRVIRLLPSYLVGILLYYAIFPHMGRGPFWQNQLKLSELCSQIWRPLLFVDNLVENGNNMCMGWGWYLQNDVQLFLFSMLILLIFIKSKFWGYLTIFISVALNFAFVMQQTFQNGEKWLNHMSDATQSQKYQLDVYFKPWGRCPPYLYGLLLGIFYSNFLNFEKKSKEKGIIKQLEQASAQIESEQQKKPVLSKLKQIFQRNTTIRRSVEILGLLICLFICFIPRTNQGSGYWPQFVHSIYLTYAKLAFVFGVSLVILPSILLPTAQNGSNLLVRFLLDTKFFNFIAKVSFCTYLVHLTLLLIYFGSSKIDFYYAFFPAFVIFVAFAVLSVLFGTVLVYLVEAPFSKMQKQLIKRLVKQKPVEKNMNNEINQSYIQKGVIEDAKQKQMEQLKENNKEEIQIKKGP